MAVIIFAPAVARVGDSEGVLGVDEGSCVLAGSVARQEEREVRV